MAHDLHSIKKLAETVQGRTRELLEFSEPYHARLEGAQTALCNAVKEFTGEPVGHLFDHV